jgi:hypothetical protein
MTDTDCHLDRVGEGSSRKNLLVGRAAALRPRYSREVQQQVRCSTCTGSSIVDGSRSNEVPRWIRVEFGTKRRVSDQLSDYGCAHGHQSAHVHAPLSRSTTVARGVPILVRDEEVAGSNPVTPTSKGPGQRKIRLTDRYRWSYCLTIRLTSLAAIRAQTGDP